MSRIVTVQDISCVGQCSITVALPIVSAFGVETCILPSAVLSTHTGGFKGFTFRDLTDDMPNIYRHWQKEKIDFDAIYTGYLGNAKQVDFILEMASMLLKKDGLLIVDPAMADYGKLYTGFDGAFVDEMARLCAHADYLMNAANSITATSLTGPTANSVSITSGTWVWRPAGNSWCSVIISSPSSTKWIPSSSMKPGRR